MILPQLLIKENFLSQYECDALVNFLEQDDVWDEPGHGDLRERRHYQRSVSDVPPNLTDLVRGFQSRKKAALEEFYGETLVKLRRSSFRKWVPGDFQSPHCDVGHADGKVIFTQNEGTLSLHHNDFATVTYLNGNFEGGEVYFHHFGVQIIPRPGLMIAFPASPQYLHGVNEIKSGNRYIITSFWPRARTLIHNLIPSLETNWWHDVENIHEVMSLLPEEDIERVPLHLRPPQASDHD